MESKKIKLLIVDDSSMVRGILREIFDSDPQIEVIGEAENGKVAIELTKRLKPDIITMDIQMPEMDGFESTEYIMAYHPTPIIIFSSAIDKTEAYSSIKAIALGALDVIQKPDITDDKFKEISELILSKVKSLSQIKVISHIRGKRKKRLEETPTDLPESPKTGLKQIESGSGSTYKLLGIGSSTGGPYALETFLTEFPDSFSLPIVVVQHICDGFIDSLVELLDDRISMTVKIAENGEKLNRGTVYFAPNNVQLLIDREERILLDSHLPRWGVFKPSINYLFNTMADVYRDKGIGVILTGMGNDGAEGLMKMRESGAVTIAQDQESSLIFGMPKAAIDLGAAKYVIPLQEIANQIKLISG